MINSDVINSAVLNSELMQARSRRCLAATLVACVLWLAGCASEPATVEERSLDTSPPRPEAAARSNAPAAGGYRVVRGDTLYSIAFKRGLDYRDVATWNGITPPYTILVGQELRLNPAGAQASAQVVARLPVAQQSSAPPVVAAASPQSTASSATAPPAATKAAATSGSMFENVSSEPASSIQPTASANPPAAAANTPPTAAVSAPPAVAVATPPVPVAVAPPKPAVEEPSPRSANDAATASVSGIAWRWPGGGKVIGGFVAGDQTKQGVDIAGAAGDQVVSAADGEVVYSGNGLLGYGELIIVKHNASFLSAYGHNRKRLVAEGDRVRAGQQIAEMGSSASSRDELHFEIRKNGKPVNPLDYLPAR